MRDRLPVLAAIAPVAAKFLQADDRQELSHTAREVAAALGDAGVKQGLAQFAKTIGT
jgi:hypothetical protein